jgi:dienelactone hydrolase
MKVFLIISSLLFLSNVRADCSHKTLHFKKNDFAIEVLNYQPDSPKSHVIIVPPTGGTNFLDRRYASGLCSRGINALILSHWTNDDEYNIELSIHTRFYGRVYEAIGVLLDELPAKTKIGIMGTSVGGLHAAIAASRYQQISSAFIISGGAHIPSIIANSDQALMKKIWQERRKLYNFQDKTRIHRGVRESY